VRFPSYSSSQASPLRSFTPFPTRRRVSPRHPRGRPAHGNHGATSFVKHLLCATFISSSVNNPCEVTD
jgi:hypothetical protein